MKILMINKFLYPNGGSETYIFKLGDCLKSMGHEVEYFGMEHEGRCVGNSVDAYTSDMDFHGGSKIAKLTYPLKTIYSKEARQKIRLVLDDFKPDVCHLNNFNYQLTPSIILEIKKWSKESGHDCKIVYTAHDYQLICPNHAMYDTNGNVCERCVGGRFISCTKGGCIHSSKAKSIIGTMEAMYWNKNGVYKNIDTIICPSEFMKDMLDTNPVFKGKTIALHNFIDRVEEKQVDKEDYVLYFGRFSKEKGIETILATSDIDFVCAGTGPLEEELNKPNIKNIGFKSGEELEMLIRKAKCSVYPSVWYENCPFSVMESIMYGTPVVGARIGGIPELINDGVTGVLFEAGNADEFKSAIESIINNNEKAQAMSKACLETKFDTLEEYTDKLINIYTKD